MCCVGCYSVIARQTMVWAIFHLLPINLKFQSPILSQFNIALLVVNRPFFCWMGLWSHPSYNCCYLSHVSHVSLPVMIRNVLALGVGHATSCQLAPKQFTLIINGVTCIYHQETWHVYKVYVYKVYVYKVNWQLLSITKIMVWNITIFTQLHLFLNLAPCEGHPRYRGRINAPCPVISGLGGSRGCSWSVWYVCTDHSNRDRK